LKARSSKELDTSMPYKKANLNAVFTHTGLTTMNRTENLYKSILLLSSSHNI